MKVLKWPGAKWSIAERIINMMPEHKIYIEPFFGSGAVFFNKSSCNLEILNDLDNEVVNLFKVIRDYPEELANKIYFTPYSREEYKESYKRNDKELDDIEKARQFLIRSNMARAGMQYYSSSFRTCGPKLAEKVKQRVTREWNRIPQNILNAADRLKYAEIENINSLDLIKKYNRSDCLIYVDPPYLLSTRKQKYYNVEMTENEEHIELLNVLKNHSGPVIISGYDSDLYNDILLGWNRISIKANAEQGKKRTEVLWFNYDLSKQIEFKF
ncbi:DNA adenine methylase [Clostridium perfringens]|nr:DNA adenine methylase [Clostridium perfringens]EGT3603447.1 DNA adenine methylase [Clostridium perfringens]HAT4228780.1 DNA adenine methylase [Clostridium perfringens]HBJ6023839.1 DNA adenine methylase [Clostridium perfringens]HBJ6107653.1 DNA adenine methylase [Clostridium perfringens]